MTLRLFLVSMFVCAGIMLSFVWTAPNGPDHFGIPNQLAFTFFIIGLASFLVWVTTMVIEIRDKVGKV